MEIAGSDQLTVSGVVAHAANVTANSCFVAIRGLSNDGHCFVDEAVRNGASVVVSEESVRVPSHVTNVIVRNSRDALARLAAHYYGEPTRFMRLIGITGTNGKTTISYLIESILKSAQAEVGVVGTINYRYKKTVEKMEHTTPGADFLQKLFAQMRQEGVQDVVMEVSSHSLAQDRIIACHFDGAIFTNLTQDHLDFHSDMTDYYNAKARLFRQCLVVSEKKNPWAVINMDDAYGSRLSREVSLPCYRYSVASRDCEIYASELTLSINGIEMTVHTPKGLISIRSPLKGLFNVSNILAALSAAVAMGLEPMQIQAGIARLESVPGRLQEVAAGREFSVLVDYAHTPDALKNVLMTLRPLTQGRLITVFGCGGDRDRKKRPLMGREAQMLSDVVIVTSDNPRSEEPMAIIKDIMSGLTTDTNVNVVVKRREAISMAIAMAKAGDVILIAGKGHEDYQIIGKKRHRFDDALIAREILLS